MLQDKLKLLTGSLSINSLHSSGSTHGMWCSKRANTTSTQWLSMKLITRAVCRKSKSVEDSHVQLYILNNTALFASRRFQRELEWHKMFIIAVKIEVALWFRQQNLVIFLVLMVQPDHRYSKHKSGNLKALNTCANTTKWNTMCPDIWKTTKGQHNSNHSVIVLSLMENVGNCAGSILFITFICSIGMMLLK